MFRIRQAKRGTLFRVIVSTRASYGCTPTGLPTGIVSVGLDVTRFRRAGVQFSSGQNIFCFSFLFLLPKIRIAKAGNDFCTELDKMRSNCRFAFNPMVGGIIIFSIFSVSFLIQPPVLASEAGPLKIALLPILDALPFYVAEDNGYFEKQGVQVKAVPVASAMERDQLMQSGEIDGMLNEMISSANFNREQIRVKIVSAARKAYPDDPLFRILSAPGSQIDTPEKLAGASIGISKNTIIEYVTDRLLADENIPAAQIEKQSIPVIPERYQLLMQNRIKAATLPDPLAKSAMQAGAVLVVDDAKHPRYSMSVLTFSLQTLEKRPGAVRGFLMAWDQAAADINASPEAHRELLLKKIRVPKNVQYSYKIPAYPRKEVPEPGQWADVMDWMVSKGLLNQALRYEDCVTTNFLP
jgi:NitT/TauT family transport system substrate-binding protein